MRPASYLLALAMTFGTASNARADDTQATAQALYDRATGLMDEKKFAEACPKLEEVTRLIPDGIGAKMTLAECYEGLGRTASAWSEYKRAIVAAGQKGQRDRVERAARRVRDLEAKLSTITIRIAAPIAGTPGLEVRRNDIVVGAGQLGEAVPVDPGSHTITANASGKTPWTRRVEIGATRTAAVIEIDALIDDPSWVDPAARARTIAPPSSAPESVREPWQLPVGLTMAGLGVAAAGTGVALGAMALGRLSDSESDDHCFADGDRFVCDEEGREAREEAGALGNVSTVLVIAGGAVLATGVLFAAIPFGTTPADGAASLVVTPGGLSLRGAF